MPRRTYPRQRVGARQRGRRPVAEARAAAPQPTITTFPWRALVSLDHVESVAVRAAFRREDGSLAVTRIRFHMGPDAPPPMPTSEAQLPDDLRRSVALLVAKWVDTMRLPTGRPVVVERVPPGTWPEQYMPRNPFLDCNLGP